MRPFGVDQEIELLVVEHEPKRRIAWQTQGVRLASQPVSDLSQLQRFLLEQEDGATRLRVELELRPEVLCSVRTWRSSVAARRGAWTAYSSGSTLSRGEQATPEAQQPPPPPAPPPQSPPPPPTKTAPDAKTCLAAAAWTSATAADTSRPMRSAEVSSFTRRLTSLRSARGNRGATSPQAWAS